jgi:hypothetical protein
MPSRSGLTETPSINTHTRAHPSPLDLISPLQIGPLAYAFMRKKQIGTPSAARPLRSTQA